MRDSNKIMYDLVIVVLTYINSEDLHDFVLSTKKILNCSYKIIIVDSFYNDETKQKISQFAYLNELDFISIENKGYSYGNNIGIKYALENYKFRHLIISNPDIIIKKFNYNEIKNVNYSIIGPKIIRYADKLQNPAITKNLFILRSLKYYGYKYNRIFFYIFVFLNKTLKLFFDYNHKQNVYMLHGSFLIIPSKIISDLGDIFDNEMFLFNEEDYLANKCQLEKIDMVYNPNIKVYHKEDGSIKI